MTTKYIFVIGGVTSSLGKGVMAGSLGRLLKNRGLRVALQKFDPYINVDPGTMSPYQHGEVFVTEDGAETDLDLGHYERFVDINLNRNSNVTAGKIYWSVISKERRGDYLGSTVQVIPHLTNEIKDSITRVARDNSCDVVITEIGGTVGDIESLPFLEAIRQLKNDLGRDNVLYVHVTLVPFLKTAGEAKTKPTQHSVKELRSIGIQPDIIVCRASRPLSQEMEEKIALFCDIRPEAVIQSLDVPSIYQIPLNLASQGLDQIVVEQLNIAADPPDLQEWEELVSRIQKPLDTVEVALVGKYTELPDAYFSVAEALCHAGIYHGRRVNIRWVKAAEAAADLFSGVHGIIVPGGFGERGVDGILAATEYAWKEKIPYFGICLGMQLAVVLFARKHGLVEAHSTEFAKEACDPVVHFLPGQQEERELGGSMRLGAFPCRVEKNTLLWKAYRRELVHERHRHRYEVNSDYLNFFREKGLVISGMSPDGTLVEAVELPGEEHPWFLGCQFHPEFKSRPNRPHPLFCDFISRAVQQKKRIPELPVENI